MFLFIFPHQKGVVLWNTTGKEEMHQWNTTPRAAHEARGRSSTHVLLMSTFCLSAHVNHAITAFIVVRRRWSEVADPSGGDWAGINERAVGIFQWEPPGRPRPVVHPFCSPREREAPPGPVPKINVFLEVSNFGYILFYFSLL